MLFYEAIDAPSYFFQVIFLPFISETLYEDIRRY